MINFHPQNNALKTSCFDGITFFRAVKILLDAGANPNLSYEFRGTHRSDGNGDDEPPHCKDLWNNKRQYFTQI